MKKLTAVIRRVNDEYRDAQRRAREPQLPLAEPAPAPVTSACLFERETGEPCPICRRAPKPVVNADTTDHQADAEVARDEIASDNDETLMLPLGEAGVLRLTVPASWTDEDRAAIIAWASERTVGDDCRGEAQSKAQ